MVRTALSVIVSALVFSVAAHAEDLVPSTTFQLSEVNAIAEHVGERPLVNTERAKMFEESLTTTLTRAPQQRPAGLMLLYTGLIGLESYDIYSTRTALNRGGLEANPMMKSAVKNSTAFVTLKTGMMALTIFGAERLWRTHHRVAAFALMTASNGFMTFVAANNAKVIGKLR